MGTMSSQTLAALEMVRRRIDSDFADPSVGFPSISFVSYREWVGDSEGLGDASAGYDADDPVCICGGRSFPVSLRSGVEGAVAAIASALQDDVMDGRHRPWPQIGPSHIVLEPTVDAMGLAVWSSADGAVRCPVGYLGATFGAFGLHV